MVSRAVAAVFLASCLTVLPHARAGSPAPAFQPFGTQPIGYMVKDGKGVIWGATSVPYLPLYRMTATGWTAVQSAGDFNRYARLTLAADGSLYGLLISDATRTGAVVHYTASGARTLGTFPWTHPVSELLIDRDGSAWVTGPSREIRHVLGHGKPDATYTIPETAYKQNVFIYNPQSDTLPVGAATDGTGRVWFYSKPDRPNGLPAIRGMIVYNGETYTQIPSIFDAPDEAIEALIPKDKGHFWALYPNTGLMSIDTDTYTAERIAEPSPEAFRHPRQLIKDGADWLLITQPVRPPQELQGTLWRFHTAQAKSDKPGWTKLADGFETSASWPETPTPVAITAAGIWIGDSARGVWWFDRQTGKRQLVDWHQGFALPGVSSFVNTQDGHILATHDYSVPLVLPNTPPPAAPITEFREHIVANLETWLQSDQAGHFWGLRQDDGNMLDEWDGNRWISHPLPPKIKRELLTVIVADMRGRIWCIQPEKHGIGLYDPSSTKWTIYDDLQTALTANVGEPGFGFNSNWRAVPHVRDGRIAAHDSGPMYFDGKIWKMWQPQEVTNTEYVNPMPYFDSEGHLTVNGSTHEWTWDGAAWRRGAPIDYDRPDPAEILREHVVHILQLLSWPPTSINQVSGAIEGPGAVWFFIGHTLYVCRDGVVRPQFTETEPNPFLQLTSIRDVRTDAMGHVWLGSVRDTSMRYLELATPSHNPFTMSLTTKSEDSVAATIGGDRAALYEWRTDNDPGVIASEPARTFANLAPGDHIVTAQPLTDHLLPIGPPITKTWHSAITADKQIERLIGTLTTGTDTERTEAVAALARYGDRVRDKLIAAQAGASASGKWWIEAALQEIMKRSDGSGSEEIQK